MLFRWCICFAGFAGLGFLGQHFPAATSVLSVFGVSLLWGFILISGIKRGHDMGYPSVAIILLASLPILLFLPGAKDSNRFGPAPTRWL